MLQSPYTLDKNLRENVVHPETVQIQGEKKRALIVCTLKKFSQASALAGDEKRSPSFSAAFSPAFFHITGQKSKRRKRLEEKKKTHRAKTMEITSLRHFFFFR